LEDLAMLLTLIGLVGFLVFLGLGIFSSVRKNGKAKKNFTFAGVSFLGMILFFVIFGVTADSTETTASQTQETKEKEELSAKEKAKQAEEEKKAAELQAQQEAEEAQRQAEEERLAAEAEAKALAEQKANAQPIDYKQLEKNPDRYAGEYVKYTGEIIQIMEGDDVTNIRLAVTKDSYGYDYNDVIYIEYPGLTEFVEEDVVTVYGEVYGSYSYESQAGYNITIPSVIADEITQ
jgi:hypothetical protein